MNLPNNALLSAWLRARGMKSGAFGKLIPAKKDVISMILTGKRKPKPEIAKKIEQLTGGDIKAADWIKPGDIA
jgi:hypothetical protein